LESTVLTTSLSNLIGYSSGYYSV